MMPIADHTVQQYDRLKMEYDELELDVGVEIARVRLFVKEIIIKQEAQLPQRNSASAAHMEGGLGPPAHSPSATSGYTYMRMVES